MRAYAIVRQDISGESTDLHIERIRELAKRRHFDLRGVLEATSDADFALLVASFEPSRISTLFVPSITHIVGWLDVIRHEVHVWTLEPLKLWPRLTAPDG